MKELVEIYKKDFDNANSQLEGLQKLYEIKQKEFNEEKYKLNVEIENIKEEFNLKFDTMNQNYDSFKNDINKELNIRYVINKRQAEFIEILKRELKTAKMIFETPRLGVKYLKKLEHRNHSIGSTVDESTKTIGNKIASKRLYHKNSIINSSFSTSASPVITNPSELELNQSYKYVGLIPESKYH